MKDMKVADALNGTISVIARREWKALDALHAIMYNFKHHGRTFWNKKWASNHTLYQQPELVHIRADECYITFWGGPPDDRKYREGTMMDYLLDSCLYEISQHDPELHLWHFLNEVVDRTERINVRTGAP